MMMMILFVIVIVLMVLVLVVRNGQMLWMPMSYPDATAVTQQVFL
jgi:hypothetical protein